MEVSIFDVEANGLTPDRLHCLAVNANGIKKSTVNYDNMRKFFANAKVLVGHDIVRFDIPVVERLLGIKVKARLIDTLALSWYLEPTRQIHGLKAWGEFFGIKKPEIEDWEGLTPEEYLHRCEEDVEINTKLWQKFWKHLLTLYGNEEDAFALIDYLTFKMHCARLQEESRWKLDVPRAVAALDKLVVEKELKIVELAAVMPKVAKKGLRSPPADPYKKSGELSVSGTKWLTFLQEQGKPPTHMKPVEFIKSYKEPNPNSIPQIKEWLYSLGWEPTTFRFKRNKETGEVKKIEQINNGDVEDPGLCDSVRLLFDKEPALQVLDGLFVISNRIAILNGFLENVDSEGYIQAKIQGLTNTLRFKHKVAVNLPGVNKPYGDLIRGCLVCPEGYELAGSDMSSLEDRTKQHYMWDYDPDYVREQMTPDFDPHIDLAVSAKAMTLEQANAYKAGDEQYKPIRVVYKKVNYTATYGAGGPTVARAAGIPRDKGDELVEAYWKRNWAIKAVAEACKVKTVNKQKWLYNPVSKFWYSLRAEKDRFSTLNQGTGVFCFDTWVAEVLKEREQLTAQFHDEIVLCIRIGFREQCTKLLKNALNRANEKLKLNRLLDIGIAFGPTYADIH